jgi:hypothetical protein
MPEKAGDPFEAVGHGPWREVETPTRLAHVLAALEVDLEGLDQLRAHPAIGRGSPPARG